MEVIKISVRNLVEFIFREGDIDNRRGKVSEKDAMEAGSRIHRKLQRSMGADYSSEVPLTIDLKMERFRLRIEGRADGIIDKDGRITIDEIKGIYKKVEALTEPVYVHKAQAYVYAYIYAKEHELTEIGVQMTYCNLETETVRRFQETMSFHELNDWFERLIGRYMVWADYAYEHTCKRQASIQGLKFPYPYRDGQYDMIRSVYGAIRQGQKLFVQAPTGIGKTLATIYPAIHSIGQGAGDKLFYLTAKTMTRTVAVEGLELLRKQGLHFSDIVLTAKEKICMQEECNCNPDQCPYAKGHYDRINAAIYDCISHEESITRTVVEAYARKHVVCPFEMSLDISLWVDGIICDYNYVFDPRVNLKRFFGQSVKGDYIFLVDEAHNLYDRASKMYSAELYKEDFLTVRKFVKPHDEKLARKLDQCNKILLEYKKSCDDYQVVDDIQGLIPRLLSLLSAYEDFLDEHHGIDGEEEILSLYFNLYHFLNMYELVDDHYVIYEEQVSPSSFKVKLYCVDTSVNLRSCLDKGRSTIFFSATLLPVKYYKSLLAEEEDPAIYIPSPFSAEHRVLLIGKDVSTRYTRRSASEYERIYQYIEQVVTAKAGNYMIFFPSYKMLDDVNSIALGHGLDKKIRLLCQSPNMKEAERESYLQAFQEEGEPVVGFSIMGGIFSEGIDLVGERLIGAVVVGTGLPMVSHEREILKQYFDQHMNHGFAYAYLYPGMNKVLQAAGRVIRTTEDHGVIVLLDERFLYTENQAMFPREWMDYRVVNSAEIRSEIEDFWKKFAK